MALEKLWREILPVNISGVGPQYGSLSVSGSNEFKVGMEVLLKATAQPNLFVEIKKINKNIIYFGQIGVQNQSFVDVSNYGAGTIQSAEQPKKPVSEKDQSFDRYERGPINADRSILVDSNGEFYSLDNPLPIEGDIIATIPDVITSNINFIRDGRTQAVIEDTNNSSNNVPLPVKLTGVQGDVIINAENLNLETQTEGVYDPSTNPNPDNIGLVLHTRGTNISDINQTLRQTGKVGTVDTNTISADVSLHDGYGNCYNTSNPLPVSGTVSIGTMPEVEIKNDTGNPVPVSGTVNIGTIPEIEIKNDSGNPISISGSVTANQGTSPWVVSGTVSIGSIPEVEIKNDTGNPVPISGNVSATQSGSWDIRNINGTVSLPTGAATELTLSAINNKLNTLGQKNSANSVPVVIASDQSPIPINDGGGSITVDGTVSIDHMPVVTVENVNGDAFGRTRVSELFTLGDYMHDYGQDGDLVTRLISGGTITYPQNKACATLTTSSNSASYTTQQTRAYHHYQPGKSQLIFSSVCFGYAQRNVTKRTGYFDDRDGIYFEQVGSDTSNGTDNGQLNFVIRSFTGGTASEAPVGSYLRRVPQNQWNIDKCDGTGTSGFNINTSKTNLFYLDFQWLGVGRVRCGFVHNGKIIVAHEYYHSNILNTVYMTNPNLPIRCEILNTGITSGGSMDQICSSVCSEGGYVENGSDWSTISGLRTTAVPGGTLLPLMAIRLKNSFNGYPNRVGVRLNSLGFYAETNSIAYTIGKIPSSSNLATTLNNGVLTWTSANANSAAEYCVNATSCSLTGIEIFSNGFIPTGSSQNSLSFSSQGNLTSAKKNIISQNIDSTDSEVYVIFVNTISLSNNATASASVAVQWREIF